MPIAYRYFETHLIRMDDNRDSQRIKKIKVGVISFDFQGGRFFSILSQKKVQI